MKKTVLAILAILICAVLIGCEIKKSSVPQWRPEDITENPELDGDYYEGAVSEGRLYFDSSVPLLVDHRKGLIRLLAIGEENKNIFDAFDTGDYVRIGHGMFLETYPLQVYVSRIALVEDGDKFSLTEKELDILLDYATMCSSEDFIEEIMALKSEKVTSSTNKNGKYDYSRIVIGSGDDLISPVQCYSFEDYINPNSDDSYCADGMGIWEIFEDPNTNIEDLPILVVNGEVKIVSQPSGVQVSSYISLYTLDYKSLEFDGKLKDLSSLPAGEYLVVLYETCRPNQYTYCGYENLFRIFVKSSDNDIPVWKPEDITENPEYDGDGDEGMVSEGRLYFHLNSKTEALLVDSKGSLTWLYSTDKSIFECFDTGDYVRVGHGMINESYPGQTYISKIALIEDGDINSFTDEEWSRLSDVFADGLER